MGVAQVMTIAVGLRYGTYRYLADDLQVRGADVVGEYAAYQRITWRATLAGESASYRGDGRASWDGYEAFATLGVRFDAIARDSDIPVRPYLALALGGGVRHEDFESGGLPPDRTIVAPYLQLGQLGVDMHSGTWLVRGTFAFEGLATNAPPVWALTAGVGRRL